MLRILLSNGTHLTDLAALFAKHLYLGISFRQVLNKKLALLKAFLKESDY